MKEKIKTRTKIAGWIFVVLLVLSLVLLNDSLLPKYTLQNNTWASTSTYRQFYKMKKNSIDVLFLGSSLVVNSIIPQEIYNAYGITSYNLGSEQQSIFLSYYWLKEALSYQTPKAVVLDLFFMTDLHSDDPINTTEPLTRKCLDSMKLSSMKMEAVQELCKLDPEQTVESYYFTNTWFHSRWKEMTAADFNGDLINEAQLKGFCPKTNKGKVEFQPFEPRNPYAHTTFSPVMQEYLDKTVALCKENGIRLVLIDLPRTMNAVDNAIYNTHSEYARFMGVEYYNLGSKEHFEKMGAEFPWESNIDHQNLWGAIKTSRYLGYLLKEDLGLEAKKDEQYENTKDYYKQTQKSAGLKRIRKDKAAYLKALNESHFAVFLVTKGDASAVLQQPEVKTGLKDLGLSAEKEMQPETNYLAQIVSGKVEAEQSSMDLLREIGSFRNGLTRLTMQSGPDEEDHTTGFIRIDNEEYTTEDGGLLILVYDLNTCKVIDRVTFYEDKMTRS